VTLHCKHEIVAGLNKTYVPCNSARNAVMD